MTSTATADRVTTTSPPAPTAPRLRMEPTGSRRTLLDGGWWPRSTDPLAELPGLIVAIDTLRAPITRLILSADGWDSHPRRLSVNGRVLRLGYFASQSTSLLTAVCANGDRVDLLVIPADTPEGPAEAAMTLAATAGNLVHAPHILRTVGTATPTDTAEAVWDTEGGQPGHAEAAGGRAASV